MKKVLFMALCAAFFAVSCEKVIEPQEVEVDNQEQTLPEAKTETHTFSMVFNPDTKLSIADDGKTGWEIGDEIYIHGEYMNKAGYSVVVVLDGVTNTISDDKQTAYITITTTAQEDPVVDGCVKPYVRSGWYTTLYAIYPAAAAATRTFQCYYYSEVIPSNLPVMVGCNDNMDTFHFVNIGGVISFTMPTPGDPSEDYDSFVFSGNNNETISYDTYALRHAMRNSGSLDDKFGGSYESIVYTSGEQKTITGEVVCDGTTANRICIPGGVNFTEGFTIKFIKDGVITKKVSTKSSINLALNEYLPLGDISIRLKPYVDPHTPASWTISATDLSSAKTKVANSYMVLTTDVGSAFKIPAVKGNNASETLVPSAVSLLWETWNGSATVTANSVIKDVDYDSEWIYFQLPDAEHIHAGNALIAAKNALGEYIWSWHIWVPETDLTATPITAGGKSWMPCNLGALATAAGNNGLNYGLQYQWGRPTPSVGLDGTGGTSYAKTAPAGAITTQSVSDETKTITDIIKTPTVFYVNNHCWYDPTTAELWSSTKTIYDPCPAGWRVPEHGLIDPASAVHDDVNGGVTISGMYFPGTGSRSRYVGTWPEGNCYVWSCDTYVGSNKQRAYWYMFYDADASGFDVKEYKTTSAPVRCIKE